MIPHVPATQAKLKTHNRILSSTIATYFQSSETYEKNTLVSYVDQTIIIMMFWLNSLLERWLDVVWRQREDQR